MIHSCADIRIQLRTLQQREQEVLRDNVKLRKVIAMRTTQMLKAEIERDALKKTARDQQDVERRGFAKGIAFCRGGQWRDFYEQYMYVPGVP